MSFTGGHDEQQRAQRRESLTMLVFYSGKLIVIETNLEWALPYWKRRKASDKRITFIIN
jgi:hypothetical protein